MAGIQYGIQQGYNAMAGATYASQSSPWQCGQGPLGVTGTPFGGVIGSGILGLLGNQNIGRQPGQVIDGVSGMFQPYGNIPYSNLDPVTAALIQQSQIAQQSQLTQQTQLAQLTQQLEL